MTLSPTDRPTDIVEPPTYLSLRVTCLHTSWDSILTNILWDIDDYIAFPHTGVKTKKEHYHIFIPTSDTKLADRLKKRAKDKLQWSGNERIGSNFYKNGILCGIQYGSKEKTVPLVSNADMQSLVDMAPPWLEQQHIGKYLHKQPGREPNPDHYKLITPRNIEKVALRYRLQHGITSVHLEDVLEAMHKDNWRLAECFLRGGIMSSLFDSFEQACAGKEYWTSGKFLFLKRDVYSHASGI